MEDYLTGKQKINETISLVLSKLKYDQNKIYLVGSSSIQQINYFGDYDCITKITEKDTAKQCYEKFMKILKNIFDTDYMYFIELKIQTKDGEKKKLHLNDKFVYGDIKKVYNKLDFIKIDLVIWEKETYEFIETSIIYLKESEEKLDIEKYTDDIKADIKGYESEGKFFKTLKRKFLIYKLQDNFKKVKELLQVFNSDLGLKYKIISNLEAIQLVEEYYKNDPLLEKRVYANLRALGITKDNINKVLEEYKNYINKKAKPLNKQFKI